MQGTQALPTSNHGRGERWQVRWHDDRGEQRERTFEKKPMSTALTPSRRTVWTRERLSTSRRSCPRHGRCCQVAGRPVAPKVDDRTHGTGLPAPHRSDHRPYADSQYAASAYTVMGQGPFGVLTPSTLAIVYSNVISFFKRCDRSCYRHLALPRRAPAGRRQAQSLRRDPRSGPHPRVEPTAACQYRQFSRSRLRRARRGDLRLRGRRTRPEAPRCRHQPATRLCLWSGAIPGSAEDVDLRANCRRSSVRLSPHA